MTIQDPAGAAATAASTAAAVDDPARRREFDRSWRVGTPASMRRPGGGDISALQLLRASATREVRTRYRESAGRGVWNIVQPIAMVLIYGFVFTQIFGAKGYGLPYLTMAWAGIVLWQFFQHGAQIGMWSFIYEAGTLPKVWYPRIVVPLTPATSAILDLAIGLVLLLVVATVQGVDFEKEIVAAPVSLVLLGIWTYAIAILLAPAAVFVRDLTTVVPLILRLGFFASPVMYAIEEIPEQFRWLATANPIAVAIDSLRTSMTGDWPDWELVAIQCLVGLAILGVAVLYLRRVENRLVDAL